MALVTIIAVNQTGTPVPFTQLMVPNGQIPGSGQYQLTDSNWVEQILRDDELLTHIQNNNILLTVSGTALTKEQSLSFLDAPTRPVKVSYAESSQAPGASDDSSTGYSVGSVWITTGGVVYRCVDATDSNAVWLKMLSSSDSINALADVNTSGVTQGAILYFNGTNWVYLPPGTDGQLLVTQGAGANPTWQDSTAAVKRFFSYSLTSSSGNPYIESTAESYEVVGYFDWPGSNSVDMLTSLFAVAWIGGGTSMSVRIYDITNVATVAELTGITDTTPVTQDLGTLSNISADASTWEIQILGVGGGRKARIATLTGVY